MVMVELREVKLAQPNKCTAKNDERWLCMGQLRIGSAKTVQRVTEEQFSYKQSIS
jgi:hypothetical protein